MLINKEREYSVQQAHDKWTIIIDQLELNYNLDEQPTNFNIDHSDCIHDILLLR